ncbi:hypothetical protein PR048_029134 [Dryococelus australis]|uniref:Uncharacterized protein n=1 Tax=Dryococelus australis TaxID=614101 RepID=A0ABQ9GD47_9NEOP|nr:hypothetical protein PR048_029134 [Dryococelus australis]
MLGARKYPCTPPPHPNRPVLTPLVVALVTCIVSRTKIVVTRVLLNTFSSIHSVAMSEQEFPPNSAIFIALLVYFEAANRSAVEKRSRSKRLVKTVHFERETTAIGTRSKYKQGVSRPAIVHQTQLLEAWGCGIDLEGWVSFSSPLCITHFFPHPLPKPYWLDRSPSTKANLVRFPAGPLPDFRQGGIVPDDATDRWIFSGISRFLLPLHSCTAPFSPNFALIGSQDLVCPGNCTCSQMRKKLISMRPLVPRELSTDHSAEEHSEILWNDSAQCQEHMCPVAPTSSPIRDRMILVPNQDPV